MTRHEAFPMREFAGSSDDSARTFTEDEHNAIVASTVARELASKDEEIADLKSQVETLTAEKATAADRADVAEAAKETAERELADYKAEVEQAKVVEARQGARVERMKEILPSKPSEFFETRAKAWAEKSDEDFEAYAAEMAEVAGTVEGEKPQAETAMSGAPVRTKDEPAKADGSSFFSHFKKGA